MSSGTRKIMEAALESLLAREDELNKSVVNLRNQLDSAAAEAIQASTAVREMRAAIDRLDNPAKRATRKSRGSRPWARREPAEGTKTRRVLNAVRSVDDKERITLGVVSTRSGLPAANVRTIMAELATRGYVERVEEGLYRSVEKVDAAA